MRLRRLLRTSAPKLLHDFTALAAGQLVSKLIVLAIFAMLARMLGPEGYGAVEYVVGLAAFFAIAIECGLGPIGVARIARAPEELPALAAQIPVARLLIAVFAIPVLIIGVLWLGPPSIPSGLLWLYAASLLFAAFNQDWLLQATGQMTHVALVQIVRVLVFAVAVLLLVRGPADVNVVGWAEIAAAAVATLYYLGVQHFKVTPLHFVFPVSKIKELIASGATVGLSSFVWAAAQYMPLFVLGAAVGGLELGWFAAAQRLVTSISTFVFVYHFNLYPALARASADGSAALAQLLRKSFRVTAWISVGLTLPLILAAAPLLATVYGGRFAVAAPAFAILVLIIPIMFLSGHARGTLLVIGAQKYVLYAQIAGLCTVTLAGVPLVSYLGYVGAAEAAVAGAIAVWIVVHSAALRLDARPPAISLVVRPLLFAVALAAVVESIEMVPVVKALIAFAIYVIAAPLLDRALIPDIVHLAHAKTMVAASRSARV